MTKLGKISLLTATALIIGTAGISSASAQRARCEAQAKEYADVNTRSGENVVGGAVLGGLAGAVTGGIWGGSRGAGRGAAIGAGAGLVGGAIRSSQQWKNAYYYEYDRCMRRVSTRAPARARGPEPWTDAWYDYCFAKYKSFNADTGYYNTYSGKRRFCQ